jgi:hypothetical protein
MANDEQRFRNPFRSEQDAFRLLVIIGVSVLAIVLAWRLGGSWAGVPVTVVLLAAATRATFRWLRQALGERDDGDPPSDREQRERGYSAGGTAEAD